MFVETVEVDGEAMPSYRAISSTCGPTRSRRRTCFPATRSRAGGRSHCGGRLVSTLEGGYALDGLASAVAAHVQALCS
jgi:hypothetical protein